jgi:hypothetical protein
MNFEQTLDSNLKNIHYWQDAVDTVMSTCVKYGRCFSSGEIVMYLRTLRPDLRFSAARVGERLRNMYAMFTMPTYAFGHPVQHAAYTQGKYGGPVGQLVYVYGPNAQKRR